MTPTRDARPSYHTRLMIARDVPTLIEMEDAVAACEPWTADDILERLRQRNCIGMVVEPRDEPLAFAMYELHRTRLDITRLMTHRQYRRCGCATAILDKLKYKVESHRRNAITATVPEAAVDLQLLLRANGFRAVRVAPTGYVFEWRSPEPVPGLIENRLAFMGGE